MELQSHLPACQQTCMAVQGAWVRVSTVRARLGDRCRASRVYRELGQGPETLDQERLQASEDWCMPNFPGFVLAGALVFQACRAMLWAATGFQSTQQGLRQLPEASSPLICSVQWCSAGCRQPPQSQPARPFTSQPTAPSGNHMKSLPLLRCTPACDALCEAVSQALQHSQRGARQHAGGGQVQGRAQQGAVQAGCRGRPLWSLVLVWKDAPGHQLQQQRQPACQSMLMEGRACGVP